MLHSSYQNLAYIINNLEGISESEIKLGNEKIGFAWERMDLGTKTFIRKVFEENSKENLNEFFYEKFNELK